MCKDRVIAGYREGANLPCQAGTLTGQLRAFFRVECAEKLNDGVPFFIRSFPHGRVENKVYV